MSKPSEMITASQLEEGGIYILGRGYNSPFKIKILERTMTSVLVENMDANTKYRTTLYDLDLRYNILEDLTPK